MSAKKTPREQGGKERGRYHPGVVIKFRDHIDLPYDKTAAKMLQERGVGAHARKVS